MAVDRGLTSELKGIITGASSGIGRALAVQLARRYKARLVLTARTESQLNETKELVEKAGGKAITIAGDIADDTVIENVVSTCLREFGGIDLLVNNAGLAIPGAIGKLSVPDWERVFKVNFFAPLKASYAVLPHFTEKKKGKIVNVSSVAGKIAFPGSVCYAASKFALTGMSEGMAAELAAQDIDVITVCPGWVRSEFFEKNSVAELKNPTLIAQKKDFSGILMRHFLSISSEECAEEIIKALNKKGSSEIVLTHPGKVMERLKGIFPKAVDAMSRRLPKELLDSKERSAAVKSEPEASSV